MPIKRVIILERIERGRFTVAFWADVPAARQPFYADPAKKSAWKDASVTENADVATGRVVERVQDIAAKPQATMGDIQALIEQTWAAFQAEVNTENPWNRYGTVWDGTAWTVGGVA
jgi:hypothetical protein